MDEVRFMERILRPYATQTGPIAQTVADAPPGGPPPKLNKTSADFWKALRRRCWLVLGTALTIGIPGAIFVVRQPPIYRPSATINIDPPEFDDTVRSLLTHGDVTSPDPEAAERYVPNQLAVLRSRALADTVARSPSLALSPGGEPALEIVKGLNVRPVPGTSQFEVTLENTDPERAKSLLTALLDEFKSQTDHESTRIINQSTTTASNGAKKLKEDIEAIDARIIELFEEQPTPLFGPDGTNLIQVKYENLSLVLEQKRMRLDENMQDEQMARMFPHARQRASIDPNQQHIAELLREKARKTEYLKQYKRIVKNFNSDPSAKHVARELEETMNELERLQAGAREEFDPTVDMLANVRAHASEEVMRLEEEVKDLLDQQHATMPKFQEYLTLLRERESKEKSLQTTLDRIDDFKLVASTRNEPVRIAQWPTVPAKPAKPNRLLNMAIVLVLSFGSGIGLVCLLEYVDTRVKAPEHLRGVNALPLLAVIPRMRRMASTCRGGHLWAQGLPRSMEADAFRNLRASVLGLQGPKGPVATMLVTSAKPGEGKSTTSLNLAATCARAGERTLLIDCDLRRPSLRPVFIDDPENDFGLVDVLRGEMPWQRAVIRTGEANLDFLSSGDPRGVPIEILGTIELRQLITALSGHYHRVILDGPAVLGMADCRMLGRMVDAVFLVVRSGAHGLNPIDRATEMLQQSRVPLAGYVFNGLDHDLRNWASHASVPHDGFATAEDHRSLDAPTDATQPGTAAAV
jgi:capsular exopolysaccharide synthesis family protein